MNLDPVYITVTDSGVTVTVALGASGGGIPSGGTSGQVLKKNSSTDYDVSWATSQSIGAMPTGGTVSQVLAKNSSTTYDATWVTPDPYAPIPIAGTIQTGSWRMLVSTDGATISLPSGGTWAYILFSQKSSNNQVDILGASVAAGGTQLGSGISGAHYHLICWKVTS
jgi:hypothetical protein